MQAIRREWGRVIIFGFLILLLAVFLRVYNLTILPVFVDEAIYVRWAQVMKSEATLRFLPLSDGKQPLFMWSIIPFLKIFPNPLVAGRLVSVATGTASLIGIFVLSYLLFRSKKISLFSAFIYAINPFSVFFDRMALVDSMLSMFGVWFLIFSIAVAKTLRFDMAILAGFALGGGLLTKSPAIFFILLMPLTFMFVEWMDGRRRALTLGKLGLLWGVTLTLGYGMFNVLRLGPNFHLITSRNLDYVFPFAHILESPLDPLYPFFDRALEWISQLGPGMIMLLIVLGVLAGLRNYKRQVIILMAWGLGPILVQAEFAKVFTARYILFSLPALLIIASLVVLIAFKDNKFYKYAIWGIVVLFVAQALVFDYKLLNNPEAADLPRSERSGYLEEWTAGTGIYEVSEFLKLEASKNPERHVVVGTEGFFGTLPDGLQVYMEGVPNVTVIGIGLGIEGVHESLIESKQAGNKTYLVANSSRLKLLGDFEDHGFSVVRSYKKADRPSGLKEYVQHGPFDTLYLLEVTQKAIDGVQE